MTRAMKRPTPCCTALALLLLGGPALAERHELDASHTVVAFTIDHVGFSNVLGRFTEVSGGFDYDEQSRRLDDLVITVGTASVDTDHEARDKHVRGDDFLDVEQHPEMVFRADGVTLADADGGPVAGTLSLRGRELPLTLTVTINKAAVYPFGHKRFTYGLSASGVVSRSEFGMDYGVANGLVGDEVTLLIETEAPRAE